MYEGDQYYHKSRLISSGILQLVLIIDDKKKTLSNDVRLERTSFSCG